MWHCHCKPLPPAVGPGPCNANKVRFVRLTTYVHHHCYAACPAGKYSVPVLWDKKEGVIVNNESSDILRMFNASFNNIAKNPSLDLYPEPLRAKIDEVRMFHFS